MHPQSTTHKPRNLNLATSTNMSATPKSSKKGLTPAGVAGDGSRWSNDAHQALCVALAAALVESGSTVAQHQEKLVEFMSEQGFSFSWEAIRYVDCSSALASTTAFSSSFALCSFPSLPSPKQHQPRFCAFSVAFAPSRSLPSCQAYFLCPVLSPSLLSTWPIRL